MRRTRQNLKLVLVAAMEIPRFRRSAWREAERQTNSRRTVFATYCLEIH